MPVGLGLACSFSPLYFRPRTQWEDIYKKLIKDVPQPNRAGVETAETLDSYHARVGGAFDKLHGLLAAYKPDAVVMVASDTGRVFGASQIPQLNVQTGDEVWGTTHYTELDEPPSMGQRATLKIHRPVAAWLVDELTEEGLDMNVSRFFKPLGSPSEGAPHALTDAYQRIVGDLMTPVVPLFVNAHKDPAITGHRMPVLGRAMAKVLSEREERIAVLAVGGLTGDPQGYLAGWVDELMDDWILSRFRRGRSEQLQTIWDVDSITVRGATREVRNWIAVGSCMEALGAKATLVDYIRFHHAAVGSAWAYWQPERAA